MEDERVGIRVLWVVIGRTYAETIIKYEKFFL